MGSPVSPVIADPVMEEIEETAIVAAPTPLPPSGGSATLTTVTRVLERTR